MTLRYSAEPRDRTSYPKGRLAPGGRWERLLRHMRAHGPRRISALSRETDPGVHAGHIERRKIVLALKALADLGLANSTPDGWSITAAGAAALSALDGDPQ